MNTSLNSHFQAPFYLYLVVIHLFIIGGCKDNNNIPADNGRLFTSIPSSYSNVDFNNKLEFDDEYNIYTYRNFYNGGGVGLADVNNDGLIDVFFTGNMQPNKLYLNKGNFKFEDISDKAGISQNGRWSTGVSMADVNGDGYMDIYVCNSGKFKGKDNFNQLFINNKNSTFTEKAKEYGVADPGITTHAAFFDYDKDGDLDLYILNNSFKSIGSFNLKNNDRIIIDSIGGNKLLRNDNGKFTNVTAQAGIYGSVIGFGLGLSVSDVNNDGWPDIYVTNDFFERDYLYINNKKGGFTEELTKQIRSISESSMGVDIADVNNDGLNDIFVTEMLPENENRLKMNTSFENWDKYKFNSTYGYHSQFSRNTLQLNNGNNTYSEIGRYAGVQASDWSWGPLLVDLNNDGYKDAFIANGIYQDLTNQDYIQYISNEEFAKTVISGQSINYKKLIDLIPSNPIANYAYMNMGDLSFKNKSEEWGLDEPSFSNGSAYADLDNDGDMDLVINNVNMKAFVYRNESIQQHPENKYLKVKLIGNVKNTAAIGTRVNLYYNKTVNTLEQMPCRGFESTVDNRLNFGLGKITLIDSLVAIWPNGTSTVLKELKPNQTLTLNESEGKHRVDINKNKIPNLFLESKDRYGIDFEHHENDYSDFDKEQLTFQMLSVEGPHLAKADVNGDKLDDFFVCGASGQAGALYVQMANGRFSKTNTSLFEEDKLSEDVDCIFFDADNDNDQDLFVCSGGSDINAGSSTLANRLYLNDGRGKFSKSKIHFTSPGPSESTSCVTAADFDQDGDQDLFVGVRFKISQYGIPANGYILKNDGKGNFTNATNEVAPKLTNIGMVTDAEWFDYDKDGDADLVVCGEYMPIKIFNNNRGKLSDATVKANLEFSNGWWNRLVIADINNDGFPDIIVGNHGLNSRFKASKDKPVSMYVSDFDNNGNLEQIICNYNGTKSFPMILRHDLVAQIPSLKKNYLKYEDYKGQTIEDIFSTSELAKATVSYAYNFASSVLINKKNGTFGVNQLPAPAQYSTTYGINAGDFDGDGNIDILLAGNFFESKPEVGIYDASYGLVLKGNGHGGFTALSQQQSGISLKGQIRDIIQIKSAGASLLLFGSNNDKIQIYKHIK